MGKESVLFKNEEKMSTKETADLLRVLADKIENGKVTLTQGKQKVTLKIPKMVEVEVKVEKESGKKRTKKKIEVEIEWVVGSHSDFKPMLLK